MKLGIRESDATGNKILTFRLDGDKGKPSAEHIASEYQGGRIPRPARCWEAGDLIWA